MESSTPLSDHPARRPAAIFVGGQRRRLVRRSGTSRLQAAAAANVQDFTSVQFASSIYNDDYRAGVNAERKEPVSSAYKNEGAKKMQPAPLKHYCASRECITSGFRSTAKPCLSSDTDISSTSLTSKTLVEEKKSPGLFDGLKLKDRDRTASSQAIPLPTSPLPPLTPSKAAQVLGLPTNTPTVGSPRRSDDESHQLSLDVGVPEAAARYNRFRQDDTAPDLLKNNSLVSENGNQRVTKKLGFLPFTSFHSKSTPNLHLAAAPKLANTSGQGADKGHRNESNLHSRSCIISAHSQSAHDSPTRRTRRRQPKLLHRMSPITETSHDELRTVYRDSEHAPELDVISEYEQDYVNRNSPTYSPSYYAFNVAANVQYELSDDDLSPVEEFEEEVMAEDDPLHKYRDAPIDLRQKRWRAPAAVCKRGPLQTVEHRFQNLAVSNLGEHEQKVESLDASKFELDTQVTELRVSHEKMKMKFDEIRKRNALQDMLWRQKHNNEHRKNREDEESEDEEDSSSLRNSINIDEEPTLHEAEAVIFTRVRPGMVKLVDIPSIKKEVLSEGRATVNAAQPMVVKSRVNELSQALPSKGEPREVQFPYLKQRQEAKAFAARSENLQPDIVRPEPEDFPRHIKTRKAKMPRNESQLLVANWINRSPGPYEQRPVSERIDLDVLADQQIPPAPFPKDFRKE